MIHIFSRNGVQRELHAAGNPEFVVDHAEIIPDGMFGNRQFWLISRVLKPSASRCTTSTSRGSEAAYPAAGLEPPQGL
jgi:hypothetical protein